MRGSRGSRSRWPCGGGAAGSGQEGAGGRWAGADEQASSGNLLPDLPKWLCSEERSGSMSEARSCRKAMPPHWSLGEEGLAVRVPGLCSAGPPPSLGC